jgi:Holliday junction DNA helicase RuvB
VLFVDEIHRMPRAVEEVLYPALEDFKLDVVLGKGPSARSIRLDLPRFTWSARRRAPDGSRCLCARGSGSRRGSTTTRSTTSGRSCNARRGSSVCRSMPKVRTRSRVALAAPRASRTASCGVSATSPRSVTTAMSPRPWPRPASSSSRWTRRASTSSTSRSCPRSSSSSAAGRGALDAVRGGGEETDTIEDVVEPYLLQLGLLQRTPRGRVATVRAYRHLGVSPEGVLPLT